MIRRRLLGTNGQPWPLVRIFAIRSAVVFVAVGVVLHFLVERLVEEQFHSHAEFHAVFVTEVVLQPKLRALDLTGDWSLAARTQLAQALQHDIIDRDDVVYGIVVWNAANTAVAASDARYLDVVAAEYTTLLAATAQGQTVSVNGAAPYLTSPAPVTSTLRTFIPIDIGDPVVVEIHQDWSPTLAASRTFSRTLDAGLVGGLALLWVLSLPIARRAGRRLREKSCTDELTGLPNRAGLEERLAAALARLGRTTAKVTLLFVDLDAFKKANDTLGHAVGDDILRQVAQRLQRYTGAAGAVARFAGDEFVIILEDTEGLLAEQVARRVLDELRHPFEGASDLTMSASIGIATTDDANLGSDVLLLHADAAMYHVKSGGGDGYQVFDDALRAQVDRRNQVESQLRGAIGRNEFHLAFQPFIALAALEFHPVAVEALLRWTHPQLGAVGPDEFIPIAERNGTMQQIGDWVIREACWHLAHWQVSLPSGQPFTVYVNISATQLTERLIAVVDDCLNATGADPARLGFEITETAVLAESDGCVIDLLNRLRDRNCVIALDDFGTGYSSLSRLGATPLDLLKLDGSFVNHHSDDDRASAILTAVSRLASEMDLQVLAEGIETRAQLEAVPRLGFDLAQGYYLARPARATTVCQWLDVGLVSGARDLQGSLTGGCERQIEELRSSGRNERLI